jgi:RNA polymerase sigma-70 factor (ECF subfamily)
LITGSPTAAQSPRGEAEIASPRIESKPTDSGSRTAAPQGVRLDFDAVYEEHFAFVWRTARRMGVPESAADDAVQNVFLVLHRKLREYDGTTPLRRWLLGIVARVVSHMRRAYYRKDSRCVPHETDKDGALSLPSRSGTPLELAEQAEALQLVVSLLDELEQEKREVLVLSQFEELSVPEIADCLDLNVNTVYSRLRAAKSAFDAAFARHEARARSRKP